MDKLYKDILFELGSVLDYGSISNCVFLDRYISKILVHSVRKSHRIFELSSHNMIYLKRYYDDLFISENDCVKANNILGVEFIDSHIEGDRDIDLKAAVETGNLDFVKLAYSLNNISCDDGIYVAAKYGYLEIMKWLIEQSKHTPYAYTMMNAMRSGNYDIIKYLYSIAPHTCPIELIYYYGFNSKGSIILGKNHGINLPKLLWTAGHGSLGKLKWIKKNKKQYNDNNKIIKKIISIVTGIKIDDIKDIKFNNTYNLIYYAASLGNTNNVRWLIDNGCKTVDWLDYDYKPLNVAIMNNHFETAKLLYANGYNIDNTTFESAAQTGNLEMMKWLLEQGCVITDDVCLKTISSGNLETVKWLKANYKDFMNKVKEHGIAWAAYSGNEELIKWLLEQGSTADHSGVYECIKSCSLDIIKVIFLNMKYKYMSNNFMSAALLNTNFNVLKFVLKECKISHKIVDTYLLTKCRYLKEARMLEKYFDFKDSPTYWLNKYRKKYKKIDK